MALADATFALFTLFNALQIVSYIPQIVSVGRDRHGATAISYSSWAIWLAGAAATVAYATVNIWDVWLQSTPSMLPAASSSSC
jgi:hypothetical protein